MITGAGWLVFPTLSRFRRRRTAVAFVGARPQMLEGVRVTVRFSEILTASGPGITTTPRVLFQDLEELFTDELSER